MHKKSDRFLFLSAESPARQKRRMSALLKILEAEYPDADIQLGYENPFELLVATILSAQCTDERVNKITSKLFVKYRKPEDYLAVTAEELEQDIFSTGYYKAKAAHIRAACRLLIDDFEGSVPSTMDKLLKLPGVGRKTANVLLNHSFSTPAIVVDTHVGRIAQRLGFAGSANPEAIERDLMRVIPKSKWIKSTHYFIRLGREICTSRKAYCQRCKIAELCPSAFI